jgi:phosphoribosylamine--glycine ligase
MHVRKTDRLRVGLVGKDGRTSAMQWALTRSPRVAAVQVLSDGKAPGGSTLVDHVVARARSLEPDFVVIGPEDPLARGVVDALESAGIPCVGPTQSLARIESSKGFARQLLKERGIPGNPEHQVFANSASRIEIGRYLTSLGAFVVKPDGLTGGKGVKVSGEHLESVAAAIAYCDELFHAGHPQVVIEEKLDGEEFSLQSFCDGRDVRHTIPVQDHKRAFAGDTGPNTGGMGSYTSPDHLLPFLDRADLNDAAEINRAVAEALRYRGILFGGFMLTRNGVRLLEYNCRFGDPESLNVLTLLDTDFAEICLAIVNGTLRDLPIRFKPLASVCKYIVPAGYPDRPVRGEPLDVSRLPPESDRLKVFHASVDQRGGTLYLGGSRALAVVGLGGDIAEANRVADEVAGLVGGPVFFRSDIGSQELIQRRVDHMTELRRDGAAAHTISRLSC